MAGGTLTLRRQIRSITNTRKVTKAMELVAASKMRKAVASALATRPYAEKAREVLVSLSGTSHGLSHPLLTEGKGDTTAIIAIGSNRGLCGAFNSALLGEMGKASKSAKKVSVLTMGRRMRDMVARQGLSIEADFIKQEVTRSVEDVLPLAKTIIDGYIAGRYDKVILVSTHFVSPLKQRATSRTLLPLSREEMGMDTKKGPAEYIFEPSPEMVLDQLLPRLLEMQMYQAVLESEASEHSARMLAMRNATDAAKDLLSGLQLTYNQARQASITQEIAEISAGRLAME